MSQQALMVIADEMGTFHWVVLTVSGQHVEPFRFSTCEFDTHAAALLDGSLALEAAFQQRWLGEENRSSFSPGLHEHGRIF